MPERSEGACLLRLLESGIWEERGAQRRATVPSAAALSVDPGDPVHGLRDGKPNRDAGAGDFIVSELVARSALATVSAPAISIRLPP